MRYFKLKYFTAFVDRMLYSRELYRKRFFSTNSENISGFDYQIYVKKQKAEQCSRLILV
jgi:hypothetical protein